MGLAPNVIPFDAIGKLLVKSKFGSIEQDS